MCNVSSETTLLGHVCPQDDIIPRGVIKFQRLRDIPVRYFFSSNIEGDPHLPLIENFCTIQLIPGIPGRRYRGEG